MPDSPRHDGPPPQSLQAPGEPLRVQSAAPSSGAAPLPVQGAAPGQAPAFPPAPASPAAAMPSTPSSPAGAAPSKIIRAMGEQRRHEEQWDRSPNTTGTGAIHVRTFHCKLTDEALVYLDQQINEWLDAHPQYEVKFTSTSVGEFTGKLKEPHLIVQVWV